MSHTFTQMFIHLVFSTKARQRVIRQNFHDELEKYITGIVKNLNQTLIAVSCMPEHVHILVGFKPNITVAELAQKIKANSSRFLNERHRSIERFSWQEGYGAFTCSLADVDAIAHYILNQDFHHQRKTFYEEYSDLIRKSED